MYKFCSLFNFFQILGEVMILLVPLVLLLATALKPQHQNGMTHQRPWEKSKKNFKYVIMGRGDKPTGPSVSPGPPSGHGPETSTPEWNDTSETKGEKDRRTCIHKPVSSTFFVARASTVSKISSYVSLLQRVENDCWRRYLAF